MHTLNHGPIIFINKTRLYCNVPIPTSKFDQQIYRSLQRQIQRNSQCQKKSNVAASQPLLVVQFLIQFCQFSVFNILLISRDKYIEIVNVRKRVMSPPASLFLWSHLLFLNQRRRPQQHCLHHHYQYVMSCILLLR